MKIFKFVVLRIVPLKTVLFLMVAALPATCAFAQKGGFEFAGGGGAAYFPSQYNSTPGSKGVSAHASLSYNIWNDLSAGFEYGYTDGGVQTNSTSGTYGGTSSTAAKYNSYGLVLHIGPVNPRRVGLEFVLSGGGMSETYAYKSTVNFPSAPQSTSQVCTCTGIYVGIGAGLNIRAGRFGIRPELRFDDFQPTQNLQGQNYAGEGTVSLFYVFGGKPK